MLNKINENYQRPIPEYFLNILELCKFLLSEDAAGTLLFASNGFFESKKLLEQHREDPYIYRHVFVEDKKAYVILLDFKNNYKLTTTEEANNIVINEIGQPVIDYLKENYNLTFGPNNLPQFSI